MNFLVRSRTAQWVVLAGVTLFALPPAGFAEVEDAAPPEANRAIAADVSVHVVALGSHWMGLMCHPARGALSAQLDLPAGQGLVVAHVVPESPADKAGIKRHDVLISADDKPLDSIQALTKIVNEKKERAVALKLIRGGKTQTTLVKPAKRPEGDLRAPVPQVDRNNLQNWLEQLRERAEDGGGRSLRLRFLQPGLIFGEAQPGGPLPKNLSISITRQGAEPMKIKVSQGDQSWEITADEIAKLPEQIRPHVERMASRLREGQFPNFRFGEIPNIDLPPIEIPKVEIPGAPVPVRPDGVIPPGRTPEDAAADVEKRLEKLSQQLEELRKELKEGRQE